MGLRDPVHEAAAALLASSLSYWSSRFPTSQFIAQHPDISASYQWVVVHHGLHCCLLEEVVRLPADVIVTSHHLSDIYQQKWWNSRCSEARALEWEPHADARLRCVRLGNLNGHTDPLGCFRNEDTGHAISNYQWLLYIRFRVGMPLTDSFAPKCPGCSRSMDRSGDHSLSCKSLGVYGRHNTVRNALESLFADSGLHVQTEVPAPRCALRPADVHVDRLDFDPAALDVAVVHELQPSSSFATVATSSSVEQKETNKRHHFSRLHQQLNWQFHPVVVNTMGAWGRSATAVIQTLIKRRTRMSGCTPSAEHRHCWTFLNSALVSSVARQLERGFPRLPDSYIETTTAESMDTEFKEPSPNFSSPFPLYIYPSLP